MDRMTDGRLAEIEATLYEDTDNIEELLQALKAEREDRNDWFHLQQTFERQLNEHIDKVKRRDKRIEELQRVIDALLEIRVDEHDGVALLVGDTREAIEILRGEGGDENAA